MSKIKSRPSHVYFLKINVRRSWFHFVHFYRTGQKVLILFKNIVLSYSVGGKDCCPNGNKINYIQKIRRSLSKKNDDIILQQNDHLMIFSPIFWFFIIKRPLLSFFSHFLIQLGISCFPPNDRIIFVWKKKHRRRYHYRYTSSLHHGRRQLF